MKSRIVRWVIFLVIGVSIGAIYAQVSRQKEINSGVTEVSPDAGEEGISAPSRDEIAEEEVMIKDNQNEYMEQSEKAIEATDEAVDEAAEEAVDETANEAVDEAAEEAKDQAEGEEINTDAEEAEKSLTPMPQ